MIGDRARNTNRYPSPRLSLRIVSCQHGWRNGHDRFSPRHAHSPTLDVLHQLGGGARAGWSGNTGVDLAVAATARAAIRRA